MTDYKITADLSKANAAYIGGLIDADGTVTLCRKHRNENHQLLVSISNTDQGLLAFVQDIVGCGKITGKRVSKIHHTPSYTYAIYNRQALRLLEQIAPFLRTYKAERARMLLNQYIGLTPRNGKYSNEMRAKRAQFVAQVLATVPKKIRGQPWVGEPLAEHRSPKQGVNQ